MFRTLKSQLSLSLTIIILLFIGLEYFSNQSQKVLVSGLGSNQILAEGVVQVKTLEKDVLDLQRNILLYKINHSPTALKRFNDIMISVNSKLDVTNLFIQSNKIESDQKAALESMRSHLHDYQENFDSVVLFINKRNDLFNEQIVPKFSLLKDIIAEKSNEKTKKQPNQSRLLIYEKLNALTSELQLSAYKYFYQTNAESIDNFQNTFDKVQHETLTLNNQKISSHITALYADFILLTQVTRNYNYLVNVVMSGSANEFLYLAKNLSKIVLQHLNSSNSNLNIIVDDSIFRGNIMFILGIVLTSIITLYILKKLIFPIEKITKIFNVLSSNQEINESLEINRTDEIGHLMKSAHIFHLKNKQTNALLIQSQQLNEQLAISQKEAEKATETKSMFLANMSHEIRTPMNGVVGMLRLLSDTQLTDEQIEYISLANSSSESLLTLINEILDYSKIESGKLEIESNHFNITDIINEVLKLMSITAENKSLALKVKSISLSQKTVIGDPTRLKQILINLISNAIKFTKQGDITLEIALVELNKEQLSFTCNVVDNGVGISDEQQTHIFDPFTQADDSTTRKYGGTGLGLSIVKHLCNLMGGDVKLNSTLNEGSCFSFNLIYSKPTHDVIEAAINNAIIEDIDLSFKKILLVEDNKINQIVATKILTKLKLKADIADNGIKAIEKLNSVLYDLILMDCQMPEMDGYEATRAIREGQAGDVNKNIVIIALTANAMKGDKEKCLNAGMNDFLTKPININELHRKIKTWLT